MCKMYQMPNIWHIWHTKHQKTPFIRCSKSHKICHIWTIPLHFAMVWTKNGISFNVFLFSLLSPLSSVYSFLFSLTSVLSHRFPLSYKLLILIHQSITVMATTGNKNINAKLVRFFFFFNLRSVWLCKFWYGFDLILKNFCFWMIFYANSDVGFAYFSRIFIFLLGCLIILMQFLIWVNDFIWGCSQFWCNFFNVGLLWFSRVLIG